MKIAIVGCGNLGTSLALGLLRSKDQKLSLRICDRNNAKIDKIAAAFPGNDVATSTDPREAARGADVVIVSVKPKDVHKTLQHMRESVGADTLLVSCATGVEVSAMEATLGRRAAIARAMPNTAISVGAGTTGIFLGPNCDPTRDEERLKRIFGVLSDVRAVSNEEALHAVTGLSGSGPAFVLVMLEAMTEAGVRAGLSRVDAEFFAKGAFKAATALALHSDQSPASLRAQITSPAGTTAEGLYCLEKGGFRAVVMDAVDEAVLRSEELALISA